MNDPVATTESSPPESRTGRWMLLSWALLPIALLNAFWIVRWQQGHLVQAENGPMENFQAACLVFGALLFGIGGVRSRGAARVLQCLLALFYMTFAVLEIDLRSYDLPLINRVFNGRVRDAWVGTFWILGLWWFSKYRVEGYVIFMRWLTTSPGLVLLCAGVLWLASAAVDKLHLFPPQLRGLLVEELLEVGAAWLMFLSSFLSLRRDAIERQSEMN